MNSNPNVPHAGDWQSLCNYKFNVQNAHQRLDKKLIASELDIKVDTLQRHLNGILRSNPDFVRDFTRAVLRHYADELEFIQFFLPPGFEVVRESHIKSKNKPNLLSLSILVGEIQRRVKEAHEDGHVDKQEFRGIDKSLRSLRQVATELDEKIRAEVR